MPLEIKRKERENTQTLIHRFRKAIQQSGILLRARQNQFRKHSQSRGAKRRTALRKEELAEYYKKLKKLSKPDKRY
ncbi:MAG TPA: hypothetical protein QGH92_01360 [Candidatus Parcubacteria bacterium]|jgi:hypothetical protein|nr:hypothetical protein [Parcubacteria group bacterium]HJN62234.1 hypothetical protein [Candidatus Parcubacteria bacterium]|tara:strand:- start:3372 stop:3599 length:228 start_codon:yes stop_codon:yes gene_type:complete